ncbi:hypothetical protein PN836_015475 [Ningiella sp. W23]|uniref:hypothetical protein n=1 Tax=Ningiella sp. W23 TaxID=3023715 RepID=UPI00375818B4
MLTKSKAVLFTLFVFFSLMLATVFLQGLVFAKQTPSSVSQDPTRPPSVIVQQLQPLQKNVGFNLSAIFTRDARRYAVVNGEVLAQGDQIMGMQVMMINDQEVTLGHLSKIDTSLSKDDIVLSVQNNSSMSKQVVK